MFFDLMEFHVSVQNTIFHYPYGIEVPVVPAQGHIDGVVVDEIIDFR